MILIRAYQYISIKVLGGVQHRYICLKISCKSIKFKTKDVCII